MKKRYLLGAVAGLCVLFLLLLSAVAAHVAGVGQKEAEAAHHNRDRCTPEDVAGSADTARLAQQVEEALERSSNDITVDGLADPDEQLPNAKVIVATGAELDVPARGQTIALATALQESTLRNIDYGDRDSVGLFQQRTSQGWGTVEQIMDPVYSSTKFYNALKSVDGWEQMPLTVAAQTVQKSGFPDAYAQHEPLATALQRAIAPTLGAAEDESTAPALNNPARPDACTEQAGNGTDDGDGERREIPEGAIHEGYEIPAHTRPAARSAIQWALQQLGAPYQWGGACTNPHGKNPRDRCDCSSLTQRAYGIAGIQITRTTYSQITDGRSVPTTALQPGDLVFSEGTAARPEHVALYIGDGLVVHAPRPGRSVEVAPVGDLGDLLLARRVAT